MGLKELTVDIRFGLSCVVKFVSCCSFLEVLTLEIYILYVERNKGDFFSYNLLFVVALEVVV